MNTKVTYTVSKSGKILVAGISAIQEAFIIAATWDNYSAGLDTKGNVVMFEGGPKSINDFDARAAGLETVDNGNKAWDKKLESLLNSGKFHAAYWDMAIERVETPIVENADDKISALEKELQLAASENQRLQTELTDAVAMVQELQKQLKDTSEKLKGGNLDPNTKKGLSRCEAA